jgi:dienelactone hydrolase
MESPDVLETRRLINEAARVSAFAEQDLSVEEEDGITYRTLMLTMEPIRGTAARVYTIIGLPGGAQSNPAVLHIHGGLQTASKEHVRHWASQGYIACSYDWTGPLGPRKLVSLLDDLPSARLGDEGDEYDASRTSVLARLLVARCMLTWLTGIPGVNPKRVGAYGVSWGATILWALNHWDDRLRAVACVNGVGRHTTLGKACSGFRPHTPEDTVAWNKVMDGVQNAPVLMMASTNDFWAWMDVVTYAMAEMADNRSSITFAANQNHHLDQWARTTLDLWMHTHLRGTGEWPARPAVRVCPSGDGKLVAFVRHDPAFARHVEGIRYCWSWGDYGEILPPSRYWNTSPIVPPGQTLQLPVVDVHSVLYVYADVMYDAGMKISSCPLRMCPARMGIEKPSEPIMETLADFRSGQDGWYCPVMWTEPIDPEFEYGFLDDPAGGKAMTIRSEAVPFSLASFKFADPRYRRADTCAGIAVRLYSSCPGSWNFSAEYRPAQCGEKAWKASRLTDGGWVDVVVTIDEFRSDDGRSLMSWSYLQKLTVSFAPEQNTKHYSAAMGTMKWVTCP